MDTLENRRIAFNSITLIATRGGTNCNHLERPLANLFIPLVLETLYEKCFGK